MYCNYFPPRSICAADMRKEELDKGSINMQNGNFYVVDCFKEKKIQQMHFHNNNQSQDKHKKRAVC